MKTIAIVGGGFSGSMTAVNLVRLAKEPVRVCLINAGYPLGRGVAYSTTRAEHLLNVAARNMSAFPDQPGHFVDWLGTRGEFADVPEAVLREQFVPRRVYGDYLQSLLFWHDPGKRVIERIDGEVLDIVPGPERATIVIEGRPTIEADKVLLATGNPAPADPTGAFTHPRFVANPWQSWEHQLADTSDNVILLGAGLTMIDAFLTLAARDWQGTVFAVSRTGLLPLSHFRGVEYADFPKDDVVRLDLAGLSAVVEEHCAILKRRGENPAIIVDKLRPYTQRIWQHLSLDDKRCFLRDHRTRWNVTRHRIAQSIHAQLTEAIAAGRLRIVKGKIGAVAAAGDQIRLTVETDRQRETFDGGWLINCTGPLESCRGSKAALFQSLFDRGLIRADELDLGIQVGADFGVIDGGGYPSSFLYAVGPLLKGTYWETTAVPELRVQALRVAEAILAKLEGGLFPDWSAEMYVDVREYCI